MSGTSAENERTGLEIAIIGMSGRFPGARNLDDFWENLINGVETISFFSDEELEEIGIDSLMLKHPDFVRARGIVTGVEYFDSSFFDYTPRDAERMDPQLRVCLECTWEALENAGYNPDAYDGAIGFYAGASGNIFWELQSLLSVESGLSASLNKVQLSNKDYLAIRVSYDLNLRGPAVTVFTTCSTSLVALDMACKALLTGQCDMALVGGVTITFPLKRGYLYQQGMAFSSDGHIKAFDASADGTSSGDGVGIILLKPLEDAVAHNDYIHAVIKASATNNDGKRKVGFTAPSVEGQEEVIRAALHMAGVEPESIGYIETHGTGTSLGDPIEIEALTRAFDTNKRQFCGIGSVKPNVGHLDCAAGIVSVIKVVLALKHKIIPPSINFKTPNPKIDFENSPFYVNHRLSQWQRKPNGWPLRAGVSSFGAGGTNVHVVLEEAPAREDSPGSRQWKLIVLSAKSGSSLERAAENLLEYLKKNPEENLADVAYTLQQGRRTCNHRKIVVAATVREIIAALSSTDSTNVHEFVVAKDKKPVVFMFSGQGSQYVNVGLELYQKEALFRGEMDRCFEILEPLLGFDIKDILFPTGNMEEAREKISQQGISQPLVFTLEYALARLLMSWGIEPHAMIGYSIGEYVAACLAGVFSLEDALKTVTLRGKLIEEVPPGTMLSVPLAEDELKPLLREHNDVDLAVVNGPSCIVSGSDEAIAAFERKLKEKGLLSMRLNTSHAGHCKMMEPILKKFHEQLSQIIFSKPQLPYISTLTGNWITVEEAMDPGYWTRHLRETVRFAQGVTKLLKNKNYLFVELGVGRVLNTIVMQHPDRTPQQEVLSLIRYPEQKISDLYYLVTKIGQLWLYGRGPDWSKFYGEEKRRRVPLPTYPFDKYQYPIDVSSVGKVIRGGITALDRKPDAKKPDIADWFYLPSWKPNILPFPKSIEAWEAGAWLVFIDDCGMGEQLIQQLEQQGQDVIIIRRGEQFSKASSSQFSINPHEKNHYHTLLEELLKQGKRVKTIVHLWNVTAAKQREIGIDWVNKYQDIGYYSLIHLAQAIGKSGLGHKISITVLSNNMQSVLGEELLYPEKATLLGPVRIIPREYPNITCKSVDIVLPQSGSSQERLLTRRLLEELTSESSDTIVAYRGNQRLVQTIEPFKWEGVNNPPLLKEKGVYLITGGLGGVGLVLAEYLAKNYRAKLVLTGRSPFPSPEEWDQCSDHPKIRKLQALEKAGAEVIVCRADVSDYQQMETVFVQAGERFGGINGIIHCAVETDGTVIHGITREMSEGVFAPKLLGTLVLEQLIKKQQLDFLVLCSSLSAFLGRPGEVAYCSANIFLDAFANYMYREGRVFTVSINWDTWQEVGGAVGEVKRWARNLPISGSASESVAHPLLDEFFTQPPNRQIYISKLNPKKHWVLDEHRVMGKATLPGTVYLEIVRAIFEHSFGDRPVEIRDLYFSKPLVVQDDEEKEVRWILEKQDNGFEFRMISQVGSPKEQWQEHARGKITALDNESLEQFDLEDIQEQCPQEEIATSKNAIGTSEELVRFGPRWKKNLKQVRRGENQQLKELQLEETFLGDLKAYKLHPALMDCAVAIPKSNWFYIPFHYKRIRIKGPLPLKVFSHLKQTDTNKPGDKHLTYNITIMDEQGKAWIQIEDYTLLSAREKEGDTSRVVPPQESGLEPQPSRQEDEFIKAQLKYGLLSAEGVDVFTRVMGGKLPHVVISTQELKPRLTPGKGIHQLDSSKVLEKIEKLRPVHPRPELSTRYVVPRNKMEQNLAEIWQKFLGIDRVGANDNFFDLGATSLAIMQVSQLMQQVLKKEVSVVNMYMYPTVGELAGYLNQEKTAEALANEAVADIRKKNNKKDKLKQRKKNIKGV